MSGPVVFGSPEANAILRRGVPVAGRCLSCNCKLVHPTEAVRCEACQSGPMPAAQVPTVAAPRHRRPPWVEVAPGRFERRGGGVLQGPSGGIIQAPTEDAATAGRRANAPGHLGAPLSAAGASHA